MKKTHQYVQRHTEQVMDETFFGDPMVSFLYSRVREQPAWLYRSLTSARLTDLIATLQYDRRPRHPEKMRQRMATQLGIDYSECLADPVTLDTPRKSFERQIRYTACRPMDDDPAAIASPADARIVTGSLQPGSALFLKDKFFDFDELLGDRGRLWAPLLEDADYAVLRLTPDKYHYNHTPVSGLVRACYEIEGRFQSCHPAVVVAHGTPFSKNRRTVTVIDTDVRQGSRVGLVVMIEVVALMIGDIVQCYSETAYDHPRPLRPGMWMRKGQPKSLFRPGSSTVVLLFQPGRIRFAPDLVAARQRSGLRSRYSLGWDQPVNEVDVAVRSTIGHAHLTEVRR